MSKLLFVVASAIEVLLETQLGFVYICSSSQTFLFALGFVNHVTNTHTHTLKQGTKSFVFFPSCNGSRMGSSCCSLSARRRLQKPNRQLQVGSDPRRFLECGERQRSASSQNEPNSVAEVPQRQQLPPDDDASLSDHTSTELLEVPQQAAAFADSPSLSSVSRESVVVRHRGRHHAPSPAVFQVPRFMSSAGAV